MSEYIDLSNYSYLVNVVKKFGLNSFNFYRKFKNDSSQGSVGLLKRVVDNDVLTDNEIYCRDFLTSPFFAQKNIQPKDIIVYKIGTETPFLARHEFEVTRSLQKLSGFLPNFRRPMDIIKQVRADPDKPDNPFRDSKKMSELALFEYIESNVTLSQILYKKNKQEANSLINQLLITILIAQQKIDFVHNDLHFDNVLVCKCLKRTFLLYIFETRDSDEILYAIVPTFGQFPVIIDYGFSFTKDINNGPLYTGIHHNNKGYVNYMFDGITDFKTIFVRLAYSKYDFGDIKKGRTFKRLVKDRFLDKLSIDYKTGWDITKYESIGKKLMKYVRSFIKDYINKNWDGDDFFFLKMQYELIDVIGSLIILPLKEKSFSDLQKHLTTLLNEWLKIERWIRSTSDKMHIFTIIIDTIREDIVKENSEDENIIPRFKGKILNALDLIGNKIILNDLNYKLLYTSIVNLSESLEGFQYVENVKFKGIKKKDYEKLGFTSALEIYEEIEPLITEPYIAEEGDYYVVMDAILEKTSSFIVDRKLANILNTIPPIKRAEFLYKNLPEE